MISKFYARDVVAGGLLLLLAATGFYLNLSNPIGTASRMGPGYMPMLVFICLGILGTGVVASGLRSSAEPIERVGWRQFCLIMIGLILFGGLLESFGLGVATIVLVVVSCLADRDHTLRGILLLTASLVVMCWMIFIWGLNIHVPFFPPFLSGM